MPASASFDVRAKEPAPAMNGHGHDFLSPSLRGSRVVRWGRDTTAGVVSLGGARVVTESEVFCDGGLVQRVIVRKMGGAFGVSFQRIGCGCSRRESVRKIVPGGRAEVEGGRGFGWGGGGSIQFSSKNFNHPTRGNFVVVMAGS